MRWSVTSLGRTWLSTMLSRCTLKSVMATLSRDSAASTAAISIRMPAPAPVANRRKPGRPGFDVP
jgi:hypothetical protein